ncbi:hypothetical protein JAAARDRAFT_32848 [Jaapia argillacea MUCL 33604]|uniref:Uncharacterized protein n=1 Tax=Jaapia argillacea MUCL 33604 TaxID=933084 RepID=A0A067Q0G8_9AGAM|nr:hypothetical protein JAAARDRAFT_32848 [Jaapia argillacea MUCL 33604]
MATTIDINDAWFCEHHKEVCTECDYDGRADNDAAFGFDPADREPMEAPPTTVNKDGLHQCKKHGSTDCKLCFGWKKQITRGRAAAKKAAKKA